jgi:hypothetical protein
VKERQVERERALPLRALRRLVEQFVEPLHLADERGDVVARTGRTRPGGQPRGERRFVDEALSRLGTTSASRPSASTSSRPSASVDTIGFPIASASKAVSGVPSQSEGNAMRSKALSTAATSLWKPANTKRSPRPRLAACALRGASSSPSPTR